MISSLLETLNALPGWLRLAIAAIVGGLLVWLLSLLHLDRTGLLILLLCLLVVAGLIYGYILLLRWIHARRARPFTQNLRTAAGRSPQAIADPAQRAQLDSLRKTFENGVQKFEEAGKDLYSLPWYLIVGEPGSGKTEAIRHCNVGFPPGLQNQLQGVGGTINMGWWFTNRAVILDTAGRLLFQEVQAGSTTEWTEFLRLLVNSRPNCPINGLILVIPADSLILDTADKIAAKADKIAQQFDVIQRTLGVRFPVFVMITKCDLINGFREFFDGLSDIKLQHQILGWSNPNPLDSLFSPDEVDKHLAAVRHRLLIRRYGLLIDPVAREGADARRADEVDALYSLPDSLMKIAPRLRRYLEMVFVPSEWSAKPLFLRGIYFTSSMREGAALDAELAEAMNVPVTSIPEGRGWERERAYFLRDLFTKKIFVEKGLVTRATNTRRLQRYRRLILVTAGVGSALLLLGLTWYGAFKMNRDIRDQTLFWAQVNNHVGDQLAILARDGSSADKPKFFSRIKTQVSPEIGSIGDMHARATELLDRPINVHWILRPVGHFIASGAALSAKEHDAYRLLFQSDVLAPSLTAARARLDAEIPSTWSDNSTDALIQLTRFDDNHAQPDLAALLHYVLPDSDFAQFSKQDLDALQSGLKIWLDAPTASAPVQSQQNITEGIDAFVDHWEWMRSLRNPELAAFATIRDTAHAAQAAGADLSHFSQQLADHPPRTRDQYNTSLNDWLVVRDKHRASIQALGKQLAAFVTTASSETPSLSKGYQDKLDQIQRDGRREFQRLIDESAGDTSVVRRARLVEASLKFRREDSDDRKMLDDLAKLDQSLFKFAKCSDGAIHPLYALAALNCDVVDAQLPRLRAQLGDPAASKPTTAPVTWTTLKDADQSLSDQLAKATAQLIRPIDEPSWQEGGGVEASALILQRMALPCRRYQIVTQALADAPTGDQAVAGFVAKLAPQFDPIVLPPIPFVPFKGLDPGFHPKAAAEALSYGVMIYHWLNVPNSEPPAMLESDAIDGAFRATLQPAMDQYLTKYIDYWSTALLTPTIAPERRWSDVWQQEQTLRALDINPAIGATAVQMQFALNAVSVIASADQRKKIDAELDAIAKGVAIVTPPTAPASAAQYQNVLRGWQKLGSNASLASDGILSQSPGEFAKACLIQIAALQPRDVVNEYWAQVTLEFLRSLAADPDARPNGMQELHKFEKFPLASVSTELDPVRELPAVRQLLDKMPTPPSIAGASANPAYAVRDGGRLRDADDIDAELDHLCGTITAKDHDKVLRLQHLLSSLPASADTPLHCHISVPPEDVQRRLKRDFSRVDGYAFDQFTSMALARGSKQIPQSDRVAPWTSDQPTQLGDAPYPGEALTIALFAHPDDATPTASVPVTTQMKWWECLRWLRDNNAQEVEKDDARRWYVEFIIDKQLSLWIELDFARPMDALDLWK